MIERILRTTFTFLFIAALAFMMLCSCASQPAPTPAVPAVVNTAVAPAPVPAVSFWQKIENWFSAEEVKVKAIDWSEAVTYWQDFIKFADEAAPVVCGMLKNDTGTVGKIMNVVGDADSAVTTLSNTVAAYKAGTLTESDVIAAAQSTEKNVVAAVNLVATTKANPTSAVVTPPLAK